MSNDNYDPLDNEKTIEQPVFEPGSYLLSTGQSLGQYKIIRPLGRGGMGEVYEVEHTTLGRRYALKLLPSDFIKSPNALERFRREARVMANLEHPNIIRVDEFGETDGRYWLRMELADGLRPEEDGGQKPEDRLVTLADLAKACGGKVPQETLLPILRQVLEALDYAHGHGAVHRDLKPSNILLTQNIAEVSPVKQGFTGQGGQRSEVGLKSKASGLKPFSAKISDFGLVKLVGEEWLQSMVQLSVQRSMSIGDEQTIGREDGLEGSSTRSMLGTYEYMSPEQKRGEEADARSDLYSVGLMAYRLLTGRGLGMKTPSQIDKELVSSWDAFVADALEELPGERLQNAKEGLKLLDRVSQDLDTDQQKEQQKQERRETERAQAAREQEETRRKEAQAIAEQRAQAEEERRRQDEVRSKEGDIDVGFDPIEALHDLMEVPNTDYAPLDGLAQGSSEAQDRQMMAVRETGLPLQVKSKVAGIAFRLVPAGTFKMGSPLEEIGRELNEKQHQVTLSEPFYCGMFPITQGQWERVLGDNPSYFKKKVVEMKGFLGFGRKVRRATLSDHPVEQVGWDDCQSFLKKLCELEGVPQGTYRLLTEAQWEYACRAGTQTPFYFGDRLDSTMANFDGNYPYGGASKGPYRRTTTPVGQFKSNVFGLYDMHGNVWEWVQDWYGCYPSESVMDPTGPASGSSRVYRGGSCYIFARACRSAIRLRASPGDRYITLGFRIQRTAPTSMNK